MRTSIATRPVAAPRATIWRDEAAQTDWRAEVIAEHERSRGVGEAALRAELAGRVRDLTGREIAPRSVLLASERQAIAWVGGVQFRLEGLELTIVRSCVHCGVEQLSSPPVRTRADLGYALGAWEPRGAQCQVEDPPAW